MDDLVIPRQTRPNWLRLRKEMSAIEETAYQWPRGGYVSRLVIERVQRPGYSWRMARRFLELTACPLDFVARR